MLNYIFINSMTYDILSVQISGALQTVISGPVYLFESAIQSAGALKLRGCCVS